MTKARILSVLTALGISFAVFAQSTVHVRGLVVDSSKNPIAGATIQEDGTRNFAVTGIDGNFSISIPSNAALLVSCIGFETQKVNVEGRSNITITLNEDSELLEETVVVGYGTQTKVNLTGSVATISAESLTDRPSINVSNSLQGLTPGLMITQGSGEPGNDGATIRIRGVGTLNNASPYILVDGIETGTLNQIDPEEIESISVLKDASSAAIYGFRASNGVILITTKRGKEGAPKIGYSGSVNFSNITTRVDRLSSYDYARLTNELADREGTAHQYTQDDLDLFLSGEDPDYHPNTDWQSIIFRTGVTHRHSVNVSGGSGNVKYHLSGGYLNQEGTLRNSDRQQFNLRSNIDVDLSKTLKLRLDLNYLDNDYSRPNASYRGDVYMLLLVANRIAPWISAKRSDGTYGWITDGNPAAWIEIDTRTRYTKRNTNGTVNLSWTPIKDLVFSAQGSYISNVALTKNYQKEVQYDEVYFHGPTKLKETKSDWQRSTLDLTVNYKKTIAKDHNFKILGGFNIQEYNYWTLSGERQGFVNTNLDDMNAGEADTQKNSGHTSSLATVSAFGRFNYDYKQRYLFEVNFRSDASSRFAYGYRFGYFPSVSAGWRMTEENWMKGTSSWLQNLKLRASWGLLGNQEALDDYYPSLPNLYIGKNFPFDGKVNTGITVVNHKVPSISWESSRTYGFGFDATLLKDFTLSVDYYNRLTTDIIMEISTPWTFGISGSFQDNRGSMINHGLEVQAAWHHSFGSDWRAGVSANYAFNRNRILDLADVSEMVSGYTINRVGEAYGSFYVYRTNGIFSSDEEAKEYEKIFGNPFNIPYKGGDVRIVDADKDGKITTADREVIGSKYPVHTFGLNLDGGWKNFNLSVFLQGVADVYRYFGTDVVGYFGGDTTHPSTNWLSAWTPENPNATWPRTFKNEDSVSAPGKVYSDFWCRNTSYLRIKTVNFSYTLPKKVTGKLGIASMKVYYAAENLHTFDALPFNVDPEVASGNIEYYPSSSSHSLGVNISF